MKLKKLKSTSNQGSFSLLFPSLTKMRVYTTDREDIQNIKPELTYANALTQKAQIYRENRGKSGVYR